MVDGRTVTAWVVKTLESNSALPKAVIGRGGTGGDAWRDESDSEEGEEQAPLEEVRENHVVPTVGRYNCGKKRFGCFSRFYRSQLCIA